MMASRIYKFSKIQNFNLNINLSLEPPFLTALPLSAAFNGVLLLFTLYSTPIDYNDVRVEVCIIILERIFHDVLLSSISHQKNLFFQIRSRIWTCGKVLFKLDMPHVKQNPSVSQPVFKELKSVLWINRSNSTGKNTLRNFSVPQSL